MSKPTMSQWDLRLQRCSCHSRKSRLVLTSQPCRGRMPPQLHLHKRQRDHPSQSLGRGLQPRLRVQHHHRDTDPRFLMWRRLHPIHSTHHGQDHRSPRHRRRRRRQLQLPTIITIIISHRRRLQLRPEGLKDLHSLEDLKGLPSCKPKQLLQPPPRKRLSG